MKGKIAGYVTVGTNDLNKAKEFYDGLLGELGATSFSPNERSFFWSIEGGETTFAVFIPYDGNEATVGNGNMTGFAMESREQVDAMHAKALELGASDEGAPGVRAEPFYGAYVRDLDGNKLVFFKLG